MTIKSFPSLSAATLMAAALGVAVAQNEPADASECTKRDLFVVGLVDPSIDPQNPVLDAPLEMPEMARHEIAEAARAARSGHFVRIIPVASGDIHSQAYARKQRAEFAAIASIELNRLGIDSRDIRFLGYRSFDEPSMQGVSGGCGDQADRPLVLIE